MGASSPTASVPHSGVIFVYGYAYVKYKTSAMFCRAAAFIVRATGPRHAMSSHAMRRQASRLPSWRHPWLQVARDGKQMAMTIGS